MRGYKRYEPGFQQQAVELLERTDRGLKEVAGSLGVPPATLRYWYDREMARRRGKPKPKTATSVLVLPTETLQQKLARLERENAALRRENEDLKVDKDILKKAAASSTGHRYTGVEGIRWRSESQGLPRSLVELTRDPVQLGLRVGR